MGAYIADDERKFKKGMSKLHPHTSLIEKLFTYQRLLNWLKIFDPIKHNEVRQVIAFILGLNFRTTLSIRVESMQKNVPKFLTC